jgi:hypothetical protein
MRSRTILTTLKDNLASYIATQEPAFRTIIENRQESESVLNERGDIDQFHLGLYETSYSGRIYTGSQNNLDANQSYEIQIFYKVSRKGDLDADVELKVFDMRDIIEDWCNQIDAGTVTGNRLYWVKFEGNSSPIRVDSYTTMTIDLSGLKES